MDDNIKTPQDALEWLDRRIREEAELDGEMSNEHAIQLGFIQNMLAKFPRRNCDVGDAADWEKRFGEECDKGHICSDCPVRYAKTRMAIELDKGARCEFVWAQMPYVEQEGGAK